MGYNIPADHHGSLPSGAAVLEKTLTRCQAECSALVNENRDLRATVKQLNQTVENLNNECNNWSKMLQGELND